MYKEIENQEFIKDLGARVEFTINPYTINLTGSWLWSTIDEKQLLSSFRQISNNSVIIDGSSINKIDTTGAYFINKLIKYLKNNQIELTSIKLNDNCQKLFDRVSEHITTAPINKNKNHKAWLIIAIGRYIYSIANSFLELTSFFGQVLINFVYLIKSPRSIKWQQVIDSISDTGIKGLGISMLLSFLIGITLTYEMSPQFITYGANIYVVNFLGIALLKEVSPLLTAIIVAGRTGSGIAAEIGAMKVQEELDAIQTMGISPIKSIVVPKILGVMIAVPLITSIADIASLCGGAIVANGNLEVNYSLFLERLQTYVSIHNYVDGIIKSCAFAFLIALVGCFCGFRVKGNAISLGKQTTQSVVLGILLVVLADAVFAIIFQTLGI